jgi:carbonic anhydrase/acetyltransferase-like protein (isoleucine patch superfamily)
VGSAGTSATLNVAGTATVSGKLTVDQLAVTNDVTISSLTADQLAVTSDATVGKTLAVAGDVTVGSDSKAAQLTVKGNTKVTEDLTVQQNFFLSNNSKAGVGVADPQSTVDVLGSMTIGSKDFAGKKAAPEHGLLIEGNLIIGNKAPTDSSNAALFVDGAIRCKNLVVNQKLDINDTLQGDRLIAQSGRIGSDTNSDLLLQTGDTARLTISKNDGKVTIRGKLSVNGGSPPPDAVLFANGNLFVEGKAFARESRSQAFQQVSSRALKDNISDLDGKEAGTILRALNPVKFTYKADPSSELQAGFIVENTPDLLISPDKQAIKLLDVVTVLTKVVQDNRETITNLFQLVAQQEKAIKALTEQVKALEKS